MLWSTPRISRMSPAAVGTFRSSPRLRRKTCAVRLLIRRICILNPREYISGRSEWMNEWIPWHTSVEYPDHLQFAYGVFIVVHQLMKSAQHSMEANHQFSIIGNLILRWRTFDDAQNLDRTKLWSAIVIKRLKDTIKAFVSGRHKGIASDLFSIGKLGIRNTAGGYRGKTDSTEPHQDSAYNGQWEDPTRWSQTTPLGHWRKRRRCGDYGIRPTTIYVGVSYHNDSKRDSESNTDAVSIAILT